MKLKIYFHTFFLLTLVLVSCEDDGYEDFENEKTRVQPLSGEWWIVGYAPDGTPAFAGDYNLWSTYNTAQNNDSMWIDDHGSFFELKTKVLANVEALTFTGAPNSPELITGGTVTVSNGKILPGQGRSAVTNTPVDSIYFEAEFDWEPGVIYTFGGHERTGFLEDENPTLH